MALTTLLEPLNLLAAAVIALFSTIVYRLYFHPLAHIPGPFLARFTSLWLYRLSYSGTEATTIDGLHKKYGPVVRIAPNDVDISDGAALNPIYVKSGGMLKESCYRNFDIDEFPTIFSVIDPAHRVIRSKAVVAMFAPRAIQDAKPIIYECAERMVTRLEKEKREAHGKPVDILNAYRSLALDAVSAYLFGKSYNGLEEQKLSASEFVDTFVAVGRFFYLPNWVFKIVEFWAGRLAEDSPQVWKSISSVDMFASKLVDETKVDEHEPGNSYQARLLNVGISRSETIAQCKDLMFAGTDSTGMNLSTIAWRLAKHPDKLAKLRKEIMDNPDADAQSLPYLSGVVKEGLRMSMANPTQLRRVVSSTGLQVPGLPFIPAGTSVGLSPYTLHFNPEVFPNPHEFQPERWAEPTEKMLRDSIPFGLGSRQCIARTLATAELYWGTQEVVRRNLLEGARPVEKEVEILEWFNSKVKGGKIELVWDRSCYTF
ncbi:hypothetical protein BLS_002862 [Venturia inaequalis]|uniref:Cytochrome P450 n=1 Tax=Venturia inaequalis TaxID=5025 RepID=A0A8H3UPY2_VENIN|nr:hypothetical protein EG328_010336 [Venturia inaequalis]KAE9974912.1 hypothetical protein BLS_002862 [Venturia inaequalis]